MAKQKVDPRAQALAALEKKDALVRKMLLSTYGSLTAERILVSLGVKVTAKQLTAHIKNTQSFYHRLMRLPALAAYNDIVFEQARDLQAYSQQKMIYYLYSDEAKKTDDDPGAALRATIEQDRLVLVELNKEIESYMNTIDAGEYEMRYKLKRHVKKWKSACQSISEKLSESLTQQGESLADTFTNELTELIEHDAVTVELSAAQLKQYKIKGNPSTLTKAVVHLLSKGEGK